jgi:hypothetical protein
MMTEQGYEGTGRSLSGIRYAGPLATHMNFRRLNAVTSAASRENHSPLPLFPREPLVPVSLDAVRVIGLDDVYSA